MGLMKRMKKHKYDKIIDEAITNMYGKDEQTVKQVASLCKEIGLDKNKTSVLLKAVVSGSMKDISKVQIEDANIDAMNLWMLEQLKEFYTMSQEILITSEEYFCDVLKYDMLRYISYLYVANACDKGFGEFMLGVFNAVFASEDVIYSLKDIDKCLVTYDLTDVFQGGYFAAEGPAKLERFVTVIPYGIFQINTLLSNLEDTTLAENMLQMYLYFQMVLTQIGESYSAIYNTFYTCVNNYNYYILEWVPDNKSTKGFINYCIRINATMHKYEKS